MVCEARCYMLRRIGIAAGSAALLAVAACSSSDHLPGVSYSPEGRPLTKGQSPGDAFIVHLDRGFDPATQYLSDYSIEANWMATGFDPKNVRFVPDGMELVIEKRQMGVNAYAGSEFHQQGFYGYGRYEVIMRGVKGEGIVGAFFTHTHSQFDGDPHDEIDFEFMGKNTRQVHINHFRNGKAAGSTYVDLPFDFSEGDHLYAFEWEPDRIRWYIDHDLVYEAFENIPDHSGRVIASLIAIGEDAWDWAGKPEFDEPKRALYRCMSHVPMGEKGSECSDYYPVVG